MIAKSFRKIRFSNLVWITVVAFVATSCQKQFNEEDVKGKTLDYALQVIPDIHEVIPMDLIETMNSLGQLHFGDTPPDIFKTDNTDDQNERFLGFAEESVMVVRYIKSDTSTVYELDSGLIRPYTNYFRFYDQHRGVAKFDFECSYIDMGIDNYICEISHVTDSVFIMGHDGRYFTAYFKQKRTKEYSPMYNPEDPGEREAVILTGEVTNEGIRNLYFGMKIIGYDNTAAASILAGDRIPNKNDILVFKSIDNFLPFIYWDPYAYSNN